MRIKREKTACRTQKGKPKTEKRREMSNTLLSFHTVAQWALPFAPHFSPNVSTTLSRHSSCLPSLSWSSSSTFNFLIALLSVYLRCFNLALHLSFILPFLYCVSVYSIGAISLLPPHLFFSLTPLSAVSPSFLQPLSFLRLSAPVLSLISISFAVALSHPTHPPTFSFFFAHLFFLSSLSPPFPVSLLPLRAWQ